MSESGDPRNPDEPTADRPTQHLPADAHAAPQPTVEQPVVDDATAARAAEPPPASAPAAGYVHPVAAVPPADSRWRRRSRSHTFQLLAAGLVGLVLGGFLTAATGVLLFSHHGDRYSERAGFDRKFGPDGRGGRGGDRWGNPGDGQRGPNRMPRRMFPPGQAPDGQLPAVPSAPPAPASPAPSPTL